MNADNIYIYVVYIGLWKLGQIMLARLVLQTTKDVDGALSARGI